MSKSPNMNAQILDVEVGVGAAGTEIAHNLGRVAVDGIVIRQTAAGSVFRGTTAWNGTNIYLTGSVAMTVRFYVF